MAKEYRDEAAFIASAQAAFSLVPGDARTRQPAVIANARNPAFEIFTDNAHEIESTAASAAFARGLAQDGVGSDRARVPLSALPIRIVGGAARMQRPPLGENLNAHNVGLPAPHTHRPRLACRNAFPQSIRPENDSDQENHDPANNVVIQRQQVPFRAHQINNAARRRLRRELQERPDRF